MGTQAAAQEARARRAEATLHLFVVSNRNIGNRAIHFIAGYLGSLALVPATWAALWLSVTMAVVFISLALAPRVDAWDQAKKLRWGVPTMMGATLLNSCVYAVGTAVLWFTGDDVARLFGFVMMFVSLVYVLMQYYSAPRVFVTLITPYIACLAVICTEIAVTRGQGDYLLLMTLTAGGVGLANFLLTCRRQLAGSRAALREARARATEREKAAESANMAKSTFLATMSHEIRTPLNGVLGMAQAMAADELNKVQRQRVDIVRQSGEALLSILNDVLDLSKVEAGKLELEASAFSLPAVVRGAHAAFGAVALERELDYRLMVDESAHGVYLGDAVRVRQVLSNLISNALKFTAEGQVCVRAEGMEEGIRLTVSDTGMGMCPQTIERLFDAFVQADASTTRQYGGTGLGLSICRQLTDLMGGRISATSEVGQGATFTVELPLERLGDAGRGAEAPAGVETEGADLSSLRILAAEDNLINQLVLKTLLEQAGLSAVIVENGALAVEAWEQSSWDVILMDVQMPVMDGPTAAQTIRDREQTTGRRRTPIIALTANALAHQVKAYAEAGMDGHVSKPIEAGKLFEALEAALDEAEARQAAAA